MDELASNFTYTVFWPLPRATVDKMYPKIHKWCNEVIGNNNWALRHAVFRFRNEEDKILFVLKFGTGLE